MYLLLTLCLFSKVSVEAQTYPEAISYIKVSAFESANQSNRLSDVLIGVFMFPTFRHHMYRSLQSARSYQSHLHGYDRSQ